MITETRNRHRRDEGADGSLATEQNSQVLTSLKPGEGLFHQTAKLMLKKMWNRLPVQVQCMRQGAQGWYTGMTLRHGLGREVGGGFRMRNTCTLIADSCQCMAKTHSVQFSSVQSLRRVRLFATPWIAARQASLSITNSRSLRKLRSIESHSLLSPFPPAPNPSQHQSLFQWVNSLHEVAKVLEFQL